MAVTYLNIFWILVLRIFMNMYIHSGIHYTNIIAVVWECRTKLFLVNCLFKLYTIVYVPLSKNVKIVIINKKKCTL